VGKVIFCQGMPFAADALAAAVARQTGSDVIVPPNPGTVGALGIALLAARELFSSCSFLSTSWSSEALRTDGMKEEEKELIEEEQETEEEGRALDLRRFLTAKIEQKDTFICRSISGCGGTGNRCRIDRLRTLVEAKHSCFTWGGGCSLYDKATRKQKLPDRAPDPFREREELQQKLLKPFMRRPGGIQVALADEFMLKGLFPFFAVFLSEAGFRLRLVEGSGPATLKRGIQCAQAAFCAPMQFFHGLAQDMDQTGADWFFVPMLRSLPPVPGQRCAVVCPIVQSSPDIVRSMMDSPSSSRHFGPSYPNEDENENQDEEEATPARSRLLCPRFDFGAGGYESKEFMACCQAWASELGLDDSVFRQAWAGAVAVQRQFDEGCRELGRRALEFCRDRTIVPVVVLGRSYTIFNKTLNSNVPAILREQGAIGIPVDCYPVEDDVPFFTDLYWGYGQTILRAAHQIRRTQGVYALYCSNYSCGPDSFNLHFVSYAMAGKPFAIIETDGHSGDAGTRTRVEAFLHCVEEHWRSSGADRVLNDFAALQFSGLRLRQVGRYNGETERMLIPYIGPASDAVAAVFRGVGLDAEALPAPDRESLRLGRRYTSGKECLPMPLTLGSLLKRLERARTGQRFVYVMPSTDGPCRFGVYNLLNQIVLEHLGWRERLRIWSPKDTGYFDDLPAGTEMLMLAGILASDYLLQARLDVRPLEPQAGQADSLYARFSRELLAMLEKAGRGDLSLGPALWQVATGRLFGVRDLLERAGADFAALRVPRQLPVVELTGEIYVRAVEFGNDFIVRKLESLGLKVHLAPQSEWLAYSSYVRRRQTGRNRFADGFSERVQHRIEAIAQRAIGRHLGWKPSPLLSELLEAAAPYVNAALEGEAVLTVGGSLAAWRRGQIDGVVSVGPLECMPTKIAEAQFQRLAQREGVLSLTLAFNGEPSNPATLDNFAFEVKEQFRQKRRF